MKIINVLVVALLAFIAIALILGIIAMQAKHGASLVRVEVS